MNIPKLLPLKDKHIIIITHSFKLGGAERQALNLAYHLFHKEKADVQFWAFRDPGEEASRICEEYGITWRLVFLNVFTNNKRQLLNALKLGWFLRKAKPDVILSYDTPPNVLCGLIWRLTGAKLCIWNERNAYAFRLSKRLDKLASHLVPCFISNSQHGADALIRELNVRPEKIKVIHNGVELAKPKLNREMWRKQLCVDNNDFLAVMVANLSGWKDHFTLLKAWKIVINKWKTANQPILLLAGSFVNTYTSLKALAYDLELGKSLRFLGYVKDIAGLLNISDLSVFSSRSEGCPNGVLECMASGLAVAGTDIHGIHEAVGANGYKFLAPIEDAEALADRILKLAENKELRMKTGERNRRRIEEKFSLQRMCEETVELITKELRR